MGNKAKLREMRHEDLEEVMIIEMLNFTSPWFLEHYEYELLENPFAKLVVLTIAEEIVGYMGLWILFEEAQLTTITVKKEFQGNGYGGMLVKEFLRLAKESCCERASLEVRVTNEVAQHVYTRYGFETISVRPQYYEDNHEDAYLMMKGI